MLECDFVYISYTTYLRYSISRKTTIYQSNSTDAVIRTPDVLGKWSHK